MHKSFMKNLPFGLGYNDIETNETTEFPSIPLPVNNPITSRERSLAVTYIKFGKTIRDGPLYTGAMSLAIEKDDVKKNRHTLIDEEGRKDGIERYSDKYLKKRKIGTSIDEHPYHLEIFPKELYSVMGINKKKLLTISRFDNTDNVFTGGVQDEMSMLEKLKEMAEFEDQDKETGEEEKKEEDIGDEDFDEEDDDDDYNAEKYFDDGDDDDYGDEDLGDEPAF